MYDVITVGSATVDVFANTDSELIKIKNQDSEKELIAYPSGSKILIKEIRFTIGGGGTNTAVSLSRLGHRVAYLGKIGNDENGKKVVDMLKKEKVDFVGKICKQMTGYSIILDSIEHDRTILTYKGANDNLKFSDLNAKKFNTKWFYFSSMVGESFKTLVILSDFAKKNKIKIAFNPSSYIAKNGAEYLKKILVNTNVLVLNNEESFLLIEKKDIKERLMSLYDLGPRIVVITNGKHSVSAYDGENFYSIKPNYIKVVESTGAGDAFASSFLSGIIKKRDIKFALKMALTNSESVITHPGAKNNLLTYKKILEQIKKRPVKIKSFKR